MQPVIRAFRHDPSATWTYLLHAAGDTAAAVIDPVLDFDAGGGVASSESAAALLAAAESAGLRIAWVLETHAHADHLTAAAWLRERCGARLAIGAGIVQVRRTLAQRLHPDAPPPTDGCPFDRLLHDGEVLRAGALSLTALATPGHTPDSMSYLVGDAVFVDDTLFSPTAGSARCDFPGGDAQALYRSVQRLYGLPAARTFLCHDYPAPGVAPRAEVSLVEQRAHNIHLHEGVGEAAFVAMRNARDAGLAAPQLLWLAIQVNVNAGRLPVDDGQAYGRLPVRWRDRAAGEAPDAQ